MPSLNERRHRQTRDEIAAAAVALFSTKGYEATTVEEVAVAAGVSRRTAYRHFPLKEDLIFVHGRIWLERFDETIAGRTGSEPVRDLIHRALLDVAETIEASRPRVLAAWHLAMGIEQLRGRLGRFQQEWLTRYVDLVGVGTGTAEEVLDTATLAGALVGTTDALVGLWATADPPVAMPAITQSVLDRIDGLWPDHARRAPDAS